MKRAELNMLDGIRWLVPIAIATFSMPSLAHPQSARFTIIDARNGLTPDVKAAYAEAVGGAAASPYVKSRVKIIANPRHGANFDAIDIPEHVRNVDVDIDVILKGVSAVTESIDLNHLRLSRRTPIRVSQKTTIRGY